ncbi:hypothetical protein EDC96DRAFT_448880 [Choanephora cucurbitarum]|nr:hypothetical protein EDC96DRAFT_448880 [Choanephora cucurbitarum]
MLVQLSHQKTQTLELEIQKDCTISNASRKLISRTQCHAKTNVLSKNPIAVTLSKNQGGPERDCNQESTADNSTIYKTGSIPIINRFDYAAAVGDLKTLKELNNKHSTNQWDNQKSGVNALMHAAYFGHLECIYFLLKQPTVRFNYQDNSKLSSKFMVDILTGNNRRLDCICLGCCR